MTPIGIPISSESDTAASISASVCTLSSHSPISANEANAASTMSPARQPPKRHTISTPAASVPTQVIHSIASLAVVTSQSANARKPSRIAKTKLRSSAVRCSSSQLCALSSRSGSWLHVSAVRPRRVAAQQRERQQHQRERRRRPGRAARATGMTAPRSPARRAAR